MKILTTLIEGDRVRLSLGDGVTIEDSVHSVVLTAQIAAADEDSLAFVKWQALKKLQDALTPLISDAKRIVDRDS